jgi:lysophospholipase L1-like esterase
MITRFVKYAGFALAISLAFALTPRQSEAATPAYVALGDSFASVPGSYAYKYADYAQQGSGTPMAVSNLAVPGWNSQALLNALRTDASFRSAVARATVIVWDIGVNDFNPARGLYKFGICGGRQCLDDMLATFSASWPAIIAELRSLNASAPLRTMEIFNPYAAPDTADGTFAILDPYLVQMNNLIRSSVPDVAAVRAAFNGASGTGDPRAKGYISPDGLHPSNLGHTVIANAFRIIDGIAADTDGDGCVDAMEGPHPSLDPITPVDFTDADGDGDVRFRDLLVLARAYPSTPASLNWDASVDFNIDGRVSLADLQLMGAAYLSSCAVA